jgi:hypothetical protein
VTPLERDAVDLSVRPVSWPTDGWDDRQAMLVNGGRGAACGAQNGYVKYRSILFLLVIIQSAQAGVQHEP